MMSTLLGLEIEERVALLTLNRPDKLNALSNELLAAIMGALDAIELDGAVRAVVITGAGRAFSAGADIAAFQRHVQAGAAEAVVHFVRPGRAWRHSWRSVLRLLLVVSALNSLS